MPIKQEQIKYLKGDGRQYEEENISWFDFGLDKEGLRLLGRKRMTKKRMWSQDIKNI